MDGHQEQQGDWIMAHAFVSVYSCSSLLCQDLGLGLAWIKHSNHIAMRSMARCCIGPGLWGCQLPPPCLLQPWPHGTWPRHCPLPPGLHWTPIRRCFLEFANPIIEACNYTFCLTFNVLWWVIMFLNCAGCWYPGRHFAATGPWQQHCSWPPECRGTWPK